MGKGVERLGSVRRSIENVQVITDICTRGRMASPVHSLNRLKPLALVSPPSPARMRPPASPDVVVS